MSLALREDVLLRAEEYLKDDISLQSESIPVLLVDLVMELWRNGLPDGYSEDQVEQNMKANISTIAMCVVDSFAHYGAEGERAHNEKNISRIYDSAYLSSFLSGRLPNYVKLPR